MKNLRFIGFACALLATLTAGAQYNPEKINKKAVEIYNKALELAYDGQYGPAIAGLQEAIKKDPAYIDAYISLAGVYGQMKDYRQSTHYYEMAFRLDSNYTADMKLPYAINLAGQGLFDQALQSIDALLSRPNLPANTEKAALYRRKTFAFAVDFARSNPNKQYVFAPQNLGDAINSAESEYFPTMPIDGSTLIYTRRLNGRNEDFFASPWNGQTWAPSRHLSGSINTPENEGAQNISQDGKWLVFTGCHREDGMGSCDLYISYLTNNGWSEALNLGRDVNSDQWDSQPSLSPDKRHLYFSSRRPGGYGGCDLYVSHLQANGKWSTPENLGPSINTAGDEESPFIHADNQTLYFHSTGLQGYGESDLFVARKKDDGSWNTPQNLGYPINTIGHEGSLFIASDGKTAYYAADRSDSRGGLDIYSFELREDVRPAKTLWVYGNVYDDKTKAGLPSTVELIDLATNRTLSQVQTDEKGNYLITLPVGRDYAFNVNRRGYLFYSDNYPMQGGAPDSAYRKNIPLQPIEVDAAVVLKNIFFDVNQYDIKPASGMELDRVVALLKDNPTVKIQIEGHTDNVGSTADNKKLSENRARAVVDYLIAKGIPAARLQAKGFGATQPVADNASAEGRAQNRRTALKVLAK